MAMINTRHQWQGCQERVDELTGKISVKKRDNESIFKKQHEAIDKNEEKIASLRVIVKEARQKLAKMMNKDNQVIEEALQGKRFTQLQCKRYDIDTAKKELNEDVCVEHKRLNHFIHQRESRIRRLSELCLKLRDMCHLHETNFEREDQKRVRLLMTKFDKMITKRNTASYIQSTYLKTLNKLNRDALTMHQHLDQFESEAASNRSELADLKQIHNSAKLGQESARANRLTLEHGVYHNKQIRDKTLFETRKKAKDSAQMPDISTNRAPADILNNFTSKVKKTSGDPPSVRLNKLTPVIRIFANVTNTAEATDIPKAYKRQIENYTAMEEQSKTLKETLDAKKAVVAELTAQLDQIKYNQKEQTADIERETEHLTNEKATIESQESGLVESIQLHSNVLLRVMDGINGLTEKLTPVRLSGVEQAPSTTSRSLAENNLLEQTASISKKLREMVARKRDVNVQVDGEPKDGQELEEMCDEICLNTVLNQRNCARIVIKDDDAEGNGDNFLVNDINVNEHYVTREDIKNPKMKNNKKR